MAKPTPGEKTYMCASASNEPIGTSEAFTYTWCDVFLLEARIGIRWLRKSRCQVIPIRGKCGKS
jgi:hypothetical protein